MAKSRKAFFLGVEGGATKSAAILADAEGRILKRRSGRALNYHNLSKENLRRNFISLLSSLVSEARGGKLYAVFGLAGLDTPKDAVFYKKMVRPLLPRSAIVSVVNDAEVGLSARCPEEESRILVIAGTGSSVYGESRGGSAKSIGWDFVLGDEGSGYYFGLRAMKAAVRSWDGRGNKTELQDLVLKKTKSKTMEDFIAKIYKKLHEQQGMKYYIASFASLIDKAILKKDQVAINIRDEGATELALGVFSVASRLNFSAKGGSASGGKNKKFCMGVVGSQWKMPGLFEVFKKEVKKQCPKAYFSDSKASGALGAVILAKKLKFNE